jgi:hypothetical protein
MEVVVTTIEWAGADLDVNIALTMKDAKRYALHRLKTVVASGGGLSEGQEWWEKHPLTRERIDVMDEHKMDLWLHGLHEVATVPWVSFWVRPVENSAELTDCLPEPEGDDEYVND